MSFTGFTDDTHNAPMVEINTTPLVDVMMVLLIIFIITAPLLTHALKINLPQVASQPQPEKPDEITVAVDAAGLIYWDGEAVDQAVLTERLAGAARRNPQPALRLRADRTTTYQKLAEVMADAQNAGITRLGFVTEPLPR
ncbi:MAG TPA: biopolymer transporter ExbD [Burkholderiales bacterium]|nr:biopolymer transporter ExbD [Burkholderiales bacterium]